MRYDTLCVGCRCPASACECGTDDDYPRVTCPHCGDVTIDMDGFGFLSCVACGYCMHPCASGDPLKCEICGAVQEIAA